MLIMQEARDVGQGSLDGIEGCLLALLPSEGNVLLKQVHEQTTHVCHTRNEAPVKVDEAHELLQLLHVPCNRELCDGGDVTEIPASEILWPR